MCIAQQLPGQHFQSMLDEIFDQAVIDLNTHTARLQAGVSFQAKPLGRITQALQALEIVGMEAKHSFLGRLVQVRQTLSNQPLDGCP